MVVMATKIRDKEAAKKKVQIGIARASVPINMHVLMSHSTHCTMHVQKVDAEAENKGPQGREQKRGSKEEQMKQQSVTEAAPTGSRDPPQAPPAYGAPPPYGQPALYAQPAPYGVAPLPYGGASRVHDGLDTSGLGSGIS